MPEDVESDPVLIADVLARMARGERFQADLERRVMLAASAFVSSSGRSASPPVPFGIKVLWAVGLLVVGAFGGQEVRIALEALRGSVL